MLALLKNIISANMLRILAVITTILAVLGVILGVRQAGRNAEKAEQFARQAKLIRRSYDIENENNRTLADGDAAKRLRDSWARKPSK
jgi:hypothetical protein